MSDLIVLPGATSTQGIARGVNSTFYAGDMWLGHIYRGSLRRRTAELFIQAPEGRLTMGLCADVRHELLFVGGGLGWAHVYDIETGATVATYQIGEIDDSRRPGPVGSAELGPPGVQGAPGRRPEIGNGGEGHHRRRPALPHDRHPFDNQLAVVNAKLDTAGPDHHPTADQYEIVIIDR